MVWRFLAQVVSPLLLLSVGGCLFHFQLCCCFSLCWFFCLSHESFVCYYCSFLPFCAFVSSASSVLAIVGLPASSSYAFSISSHLGPWVHQNRAILCGCGGDFDCSQRIARSSGAPRCAISSAKKIASEPRFLLRIQWVKMVLAAEFPAIPSSAAKIASERRCAILVHSASWTWCVGCGASVLLLLCCSLGSFSFAGLRGLLLGAFCTFCWEAAGLGNWPKRENSLSTFGNFPFSVNFPGPQLPKPSGVFPCLSSLFAVLALAFLS